MISRAFSPSRSKNKWKFCFELKNYGYPYVDEFVNWAKEDPENRRWGNMGYVECVKEEDAILFMLKWS